MFEQIVRPFQSRPVVTTRRIVPSVSDGSDTGTAVLMWGEAGKIELGAKQEEGDLASAGFTTNCCDDTWSQKGTPITDDIDNPVTTSGGAQVGTFTTRRIRQISFQNKKNGPCDSDFTEFSYAAAGVAEVIAGLEADMPASKNCNATFKLNYD